MSEQINPRHILPSSPYGISSSQFADVENPLVPLPQRNVMLAANRLNDYRYRKLSEKQRVFVDIYLSSNFNAVEAAKRAGYCKDVPPGDNYEKACAAIGRKVRKSKHIETGILLALDYHSEYHKIDTNALLTELKHVAFSNMGDYFVNDGNGDPRLQMPEDVERGKLAALSEIAIDSYHEGKGDSKREVKRIKFKMHDKMTAIDKLLKVAAARGDPSLAGLAGGQEGNGNGTVNVFNVLPVPSGEFLPAPTVSHEQLTPEVQATLNGQPMQTLLTHRTVATVLQEPVRWVQPDKPQPKQLTIDHEK